MILALFILGYIVHTVRRIVVERRKKVSITYIV